MNSLYSLLLFLFPMITMNTNPNAILTLTWMAGHCEYLGDRCNRQQYAQWDHQSFTINGLWPNQQSTLNFGFFNFDHLQSKGLIEQMYNYWPPQLKTGGLPHFLWQLSWQNHGHKYADVLMEIDSQPYIYLTIEHRNRVLQENYFRSILNFYKALNVRKLPKNTYTKYSLAQQINIPEKSFYPVCLSSGTLKEIRICTKITSNSYKLRQCAKQQSNCNELNLILRDWKPNQLLSDQLKAPQSVYISRKQNKIEELIQKIKIETDDFNDMSKISNENKLEADKIQKIIIDSRILQTKRLEQSKLQFNDVMIEMELQEIMIQEFQDYETQDEPSKIPKIGPITFTQQQMSQRIITYIIQTFIVVSIFWISLFILCCCEKLTNKKDNEKFEQIASNIKSNGNSQPREALQE